MSDSADLSKYIDSVASLIEKGAANPLAAVLTVVILVSLLGYLLFKADNAYFRMVVFVSVVAMAAFIIYANAQGRKSTPATATVSEELDLATRENNIRISKPQPKPRQTYLPSDVYGRGIYFGMTESELRQVQSWLPTEKREVRFNSLGDLRINETLIVVYGDIDTQSGKAARVGYAFKNGQLLLTSARYQCDSQFECRDRCNEAAADLAKSFSVDNVLPRFGDVSDAKWKNAGVGAQFRSAQRTVGEIHSFMLAEWDDSNSCRVRSYIADKSLDKS